MPWREVSIMEARREFLSLALLEGANISELCRRFGISRTTGYKWLSRNRGREEDVANRSRRPRTSPMQVAPALEEAVIAARQAHPAWGARKIAWCLEQEGLTSPAISTVHRILERHGLIAEPGTGAPAGTRFEREAPNQLWQMDFKGRVQIASGDWCHSLTVLDDHSRYSVCLEACADERSATVQSRLERTFRRYGLPAAFYVDNGNPWGGGVPGLWTRFSVWLLKLGIKVIHSRPYHPQGRGKNERFHRTLKAEVFAARAFPALDKVQEAFDDWRGLYNHRRPHQSLGMTPPGSRYRPSPRSLPETLPDIEYGPDDIVRRVGTTKAYVSFNNRLHKVPQAFAGESVAIRPGEQDGQFGIFFGATHIASLDLNDRQAQDNV